LQLLDLPFSLSDELKLTATCLHRNPKSYAAWHHRKWAVAAHPGSTVSGSLDAEIALTTEFLQADGRNFHCWNYRRFLAGAALGGDIDGSWPAGGAVPTMGPQLVATTDGAASAHMEGGTEGATEAPSVTGREAVVRREWEFTTACVSANFSNSSALHYRSKLLPATAVLRGGGAGARLALAEEELRDVVRPAAYTDPEDQASWWYGRFLLAEFARPDVDGSTSEYARLLREEAESVRELIEVEGDKCRWAWSGLRTALVLLAGVLPEGDAERKGAEEEAGRCLEKMATLDPSRRGRYRSIAVVAEG